MRTEKETLQIVGTEASPFPKQSLNKAFHSGSLFWEMIPGCRSGALRKEKVEKSNHSLSKCIFEWFTAVGSCDSIPVGKVCEVVSNTPENCAPETQRNGDVCISSHVVKIILVVNSHLLQVCACDGMAESFCSVPRGWWKLRLEAGVRGCKVTSVCC